MVTRYEQVAFDLSTLISRGVLRAGDRIPSVRKACEQYQVNAGTIMQAYGQLEARGLIDARPKSGFYVRAKDAWAPEPATTCPKRGTTGVDVASLVFEVLESIRHREIVPFGSAFPSPELFPLNKLNKAAAAAARHLPTWSSVTDFTPGNAELRRLIGLRYLESGIAIAADDIVITAGAMEAINLSLLAVTKPGDTIAIESPTFYSTLMAIERMQLRAVEIATDPREGIDLGNFRAALDRYDIKACLMIPTFQNPLGSCMPDEKKRELIAQCTRRGIPFIEDDVYAELYFGDRRPPPAKAFDSQGLVLHCSSFSKSLAPGWRIGWAAPGRYAQAVARAKLMSTLATAVPTQMALARYLERGGFDKHLRKLRQTLAQQQTQFMQALGRHFPAGTRATRPAGGYFLWVELPPQVDALALHRQALAQGISIAPGPIFSPSRAFAHCIRLNYGHAWNARSEAALATLGRLVHAAL